MNRKQKVLTELYARCKRRGDFVFTNEEDLKPVCAKFAFKNPFDATKIDTSRGLPEALKQDDMFVIHLGQGKHQFVPGIANGYHRFERVPEERTYQWRYRRSLLNNINTSESNTLSMADNQRIIHDFLYEDIAASPKSYGSNRTHIPLQYRIGNTDVNIDRVQVEIDFTMEYLGQVTFFEAKNGDPEDFNVFQLFHPFRYYVKSAKERGLDVKAVQCCYLVRQADRLRLYLYSFSDPDNPASIYLERNAEYNLVPR